MARRASSKIHPGIILGAVAAVVVAIIAGKSFLGQKSNGFGQTAALQVNELLENGNSLRGNEYVIEGQIDEKLQWTSDRGQLVSVRVSANGGDEFIGIEIPPLFQKLNLEAKQKYAFLVKFKEGGIPVASGVNRR
jgi:hypothetical protein